MAYNYWFVSRQKRQLTSILPALITFHDVCVGKKWTQDLQLEYENVLGERNITSHGALRARRTGTGGGGTRTLFKQMKDLGLVFLEDGNRRCRLTLIGEALVKGNVSFVEAMRLQLQRYQYPSATSLSSQGGVDQIFRVHPFQFLFRLLRDQRLHNTITMEEMYRIIIHWAISDSKDTFENVVFLILQFRQNKLADNTEVYKEDTPTQTYQNVANTFFNYVGLTQYVDRGIGTLHVRVGKEKAVDAFIESNPTFIKNPELEEIYQRRYGRGYAAMDRRRFGGNEEALSQRELREARIRHEYVLLALKTPITSITSDIVEAISHNTGIDETIVERFLLQSYPHGNIDDFFLAYRELASMGQKGAVEFEIATCEMFRKIFHMQAEHVGPKGNTPDVFVLSDIEDYCGIIDNKAYAGNYSITGDHRRRMESEYIPHYQQYGHTDYPLVFFSYIASSFGSNINSQLAEITKDTGVNGSAMPVDLFINIAQDYATSKYDHHFIKEIFGVNHEVSLEDIERLSPKSE